MKKFIIIKNKAFTLAEVLITLGIIGVVAALTISVLISTSRANVVVTRMQKFYSTFNQALMQSEADNGDMSQWVYPTDYYDQAGSMVFYETYLKPYLNVLKVENRNEALPVFGVKVYLNDGSAVTVAGNWMVYAPVALKTAEYGRDLFIFQIQSNYKNATQGCRDRMSAVGCSCTRSTLRTDAYEGCTDALPTTQRRTCAALIMRDNWTIASDYPLRF